MNDATLYPTLAGALSAILVFYYGFNLFERRRNRLRRKRLRSRLYG
jgi:hypothetical protein